LASDIETRQIPFPTWRTCGEPANIPLVDVTIGVRARIDEYVIGTAEPDDSVAHVKTKKQHIQGD
jgi:hypothetical protein